MATNISTNNARLTIMVGAIPVEIEGFSAESDMWVPNGTIQTAETLKTADGVMVAYGKNAVIRYTLTLNGGSRSARVLKEVLKQQSRNGAIPAILLTITATMINPSAGIKEIYIDGTLEDGDVGSRHGNQYLLDQSWIFAFGTMNTIYL